MAKNWQYSRRRRMVMQATMWVVLGLMIALAGMVSRFRSTSHPAGQPRAVVQLGPVIHRGEVSFRVPEGWTLAPGKQPNILGVWTDEGDPPRTLLVFAERLPALIPPHIYLQRSGLVQTGADNTWALIPMAGYQGILISSRGETRLSNGRVVQAVQVLASVVLPDRVAITFRLNGFGRQTIGAEEAMLQIATSLSIQGTAPASPPDGKGEPATLPDGKKRGPGGGYRIDLDEIIRSKGA